LQHSHKNLNYRPDIDGLRALAVLLVVIYHAAPKYLSGGFVGVDVFFVISGFLITGILIRAKEQGTFSLRDFFMRRIMRIFPALVLVLLACLVGGFFVLSPTEYRELGRHVAAGAGFISNFLLLAESNYFDTAADLKPLLHLWSLGVEEQFYFVWPLILIFVWRQKYDLRKTALALMVATLIINVVLAYSKKADIAFYSPVTRFWELMAGAYLAIIKAKSYKAKSAVFNRLLKENASVLSLIGGLMILVPSIAYSGADIYPGWRAVFPVLGTVLVIHAGAEGLLNRLLSTRGLVFIGLISYPLYLWHWPILSFLSLTGTSTYLNRLLAVLASFILSYLTLVYLERPIRNFKRDRIVVFSLLGGISIVGCLGLAVVASGGYVGSGAKSARAMSLAGADKGVHDGWRFKECFLEVNKSFAEDGDAPLIYLWGDSHAAALYPGLKSAQTTEAFRIAQMTAGHCPAIFGWAGSTNKECKNINDQNIKQIEKLRPQTVILQAAWDSSDYPAMMIEATLIELQKLNLNRVVVFGPAPTWREKVPKLVIRYFDTNKTLPPTYVDTSLLDHENAKQIDLKLRNLTVKYGFEYFSIIDQLCSAAGCMLLVPGQTNAVTSVDEGHLSNAAGEYVLRRWLGGK